VRGRQLQEGCIVLLFTVGEGNIDIDRSILCYNLEALCNVESAANSFARCEEPGVTSVQILKTKGSEYSGMGFKRETTPPPDQGLFGQ
jgi:hypothetical protein